MAANAALNRRDVTALLVQYAPDCVWQDHRRVSMGSFAGHDELRALYGGIVASAAEFHEDVRVLWAGDGVVVAHCDVHGRLASDPHGHVVGAQYGYVIEVEDGLIARLDLYDTGAEALAASGLSA